MKKLISVLLAVLLLAALCGIASADTGIGVEPGQQMPDFTVSLTDGSTATLSELLKEKDLVVLNIFASFCKPCEGNSLRWKRSIRRTVIGWRSSLSPVIRLTPWT